MGCNINEVLLLITLAGSLFVLIAFVVIRLVLPLPPVVEMNDEERDYIKRANRDREAI